MARIARRPWTVRGLLGRTVTRTTYGYTLMVAGKQALEALAVPTTRA